MTSLAVNRATYIASRRHIKTDVRRLGVGDPFIILLREGAVSDEEVLAVALYRSPDTQLTAKITIELPYGGDGKGSEPRVFYVVAVKVGETMLEGIRRRRLVWIERGKS